MQIDYLFNGIKGYARFKRFSYILEMENTEAKKRLKIIKFFDKYGLNATIEAFGVSRRTIYRYKATFKKSKEDISSLTLKSTVPKQIREPTTTKAIIQKIKQLRQKYPNIGKAKLYVMLKPWCKENSLTLPSESAFKVMYLATQEQQNKWNVSSIRNWFEIYPQLSIFFSEILLKYTK